jgi:hypothetical protein
MKKVFSDQWSEAGEPRAVERESWIIDGEFGKADNA